MMIEPIVVYTNRFGAPDRFRWQGRLYPIEAIVRVRRRPQGVQRGIRVYQVRSRGRTFCLQWDRNLNQWRLIRASWRTRLGLAMERLAQRLAA